MRFVNQNSLCIGKESDVEINPYRFFKTIFQSICGQLIASLIDGGIATNTTHGISLNNGQGPSVNDDRAGARVFAGLKAMSNILCS